MIQTQHDRTVQFDQLKTFAWQSEAGKLGASLPKDPTLDARIRSAIDSTMTSKGFRRVPESDADLLLGYEASAEERVDANDFKSQHTAELMGLTYTLGTLKISMTRRLPAASAPAVVWQGSVHANIDSEAPLEKRDAKLHYAVQELLKKFPPR